MTLEEAWAVYVQKSKEAKAECERTHNLMTKPVLTGEHSGVVKKAFTYNAALILRAQADMDHAFVERAWLLAMKEHGVIDYKWNDEECEVSGEGFKIFLKY